MRTKLTIPIPLACPILMACGLLAASASAQTSCPASIPFQGRLSLQAGGDVQVPTAMTFNLYTTATGTTRVWTETHPAVAMKDGLFKVELGSVRGFAPSLFDGSTLWLGVKVGVDPEMKPRYPLTSQAYAKLAENAKDVAGADIHPRSVSIGTRAVIDTAGRWVGDPTGLRGPKGDKGDPGPRGATGAMGPAGAKGDKGDAGPRGATGATGPAGPKGDQGLRGPRGATGARGPKGDQGDIGPAGPRGPKGDQGDIGPAGPRGPKGDQGDDGPIGPQGPKGAQGPQGPTGASPFLLNRNDTYYLAGRVGIGKLPAYRLDLTTNSGNYGALFQTTHGSAFATTYALSNASSGSTIASYAVSRGPTGTGVRGDATSGSGATKGVYGKSRSTTGVGVFGDATATSGFTTGVRGAAASSNGTGVVGTGGRYGVSGIGGIYGVRGSTSTTTGNAVYGVASGSSGIGVHGKSSGIYGVRGNCTSSSGRGVYGTTNGIGGIGVEGFSSGMSGVGVRATATGTTARAMEAKASGKFAPGIRVEASGSNAYAVDAVADSSSGSGGNRAVNATANDFYGVGVYGYHTSTGGGGNPGIVARTNAPIGVALSSLGNFVATGLKQFAQPHPTKPDRSVSFVCLEGNESGTYFRGKARLVGGRAEIEIPESWQLVTERAGITVQLTPIRSLARLSAWEVSRDKITVRGTSDCEFAYFVNGVRRGYADFEAVGPNHSFVPDIRGVPFGSQYPQVIRDLLVQSGILNSDYTPNEATAARLGWKLADPKDVPAAQRWWVPEAVRRDAGTR